MKILKLDFYDVITSVLYSDNLEPIHAQKKLVQELQFTHDPCLQECWLILISTLAPISSGHGQVKELVFPSQHKE